MFTRYNSHRSIESLLLHQFSLIVQLHNSHRNNDNELVAYRYYFVNPTTFAVCILNFCLYFDILGLVLNLIPQQGQ